MAERSSSGPAPDDPGAGSSIGKAADKTTDAPHPEQQPVTPAQREQWAAEALAREEQAARTRGVPEADLQEYQQNLTWIMSNRQDDRGYQEFDPRHPGGYMVIGGSAPDYVHKGTPMVMELLHSNEVIECPEPAVYVEKERPDGTTELVRNPYVPAEKEAGTTQANGTSPGYAIALGRTPDKRIFPDEARRKQIADTQSRLAASIPVPRDTVVPPGTPQTPSPARRSG